MWLFSIRYVLTDNNQAVNISWSPVKPSGLLSESSLGDDPVFSPGCFHGFGATGGPKTSFEKFLLYQSSSSEQVGFEEPNGSWKDIPADNAADNPSAISSSFMVGIG